MHTFSVAGSDGRAVRAVAHGPEDAPAVLIAHGFKGFKDWGMFPWMAERLGAAGLRAIRFDFSHNGVEETDFDRLDLFLLDTPTRHQEDLRALADAIEGPFGLLGHSRGGGDAILFAAGEPRVQAVATLAAVATTVFEPPDWEDQLRGQGYYGMPNARTKQLMPIGRHAFESGRAWSIEDAARELDRPVLLIHGTADESVAPGSMDQLAAWCKSAETLPIEGAGHTFGAVHPFQGSTADLETALDRVATFFQAHLM
ncbi:MAG: alpha/beta hydrolase [Planctomycetota bacterium]|nr:alpha/beta hydrolase [Planctomycetota bacterium]